MFNDLQASLHSSMRRNKAPKRRQPAVPSQQGTLVVMEKRRSGRLLNQPATDYNERALDKADSVATYRTFSEPQLLAVPCDQARQRCTD